MWIVDYIEWNNSVTWANQILTVSKLLNLILQAYSNIYFIAYLFLQHFWAFEISIKDGDFSSGPGMIQRHWWRFEFYTVTYIKIHLTIWQVYLPAIEGYAPDEMMKALWSFLEFCYIAHHNVHDMQSLKELEDALQHYHHHRKIFLDTGVQNGFNLPHQHALVHYTNAIHLFSTLNGLCLSITESKHMKAVKEPWWQSSCFDGLGQMLLTNQHIDKLAEARADFTRWGILQGTCLLLILFKLGTLHSLVNQKCF